ncbi:3-carboxy-cis,cis-muconate cycloisomerase [Afifella pfennigii]|uniref:3-carboxy-cis,cis-muconate cycloisomerase n=1 Tax=Afifella pfennigii TaxID=209897 RepID=UPI00047DC6DC|nr:3-carboxy-cis,cis-muconate cycloisomerase [Afifella pfennigii]
MADDLAGSLLLGPLFGSDEMRRLFSDRSFVQAMLDFEAGLARAEAKAGVIPTDAAESISEACDASLYDMEKIGRAAGPAGNPAIPLVTALTRRVEAPARGYVHWGATSQDVIDTALMVLMQRALRILAKELANAMSAAAALAEKHRATLMAGRTWLQPALPVPFGLKAALWLSGLTAALHDIDRLLAGGLAVQLGGAAGTLAFLQDKGPTVRAELAACLGLADPGLAWHAERSRVVAVAAALAALSGTLAKIATDIQLMMQDEVGEAFEPAAPDKGGSSTMPQKRNPVASAAIRANHRRIAGLMATLTIAMEGEHERSPSAWPAEWESLRDLFILAGGSLRNAADLLSGLELDEDAMRRNLQAEGGLAMAESLAFRLAETIGRQEAHRRVAALAQRARAEGRSLLETATNDAELATTLSISDIKAALTPETYLGSADAMIDRAIEDARQAREETDALL